MGGAGVMGDAVQQAKSLIDPIAESRGRLLVPVGNKVAGKDLEVGGAPLQEAARTTRSP